MSGKQIFSLGSSKQYINSLFGISLCLEEVSVAMSTTWGDVRV